MSNYGFIDDETIVKQAKKICDCIGHGMHGTAMHMIIETAVTETGLGRIEDKTIDAGMGLTQFDELPFKDILKRNMKSRDKILKELVLSENNTAETQKQNNLSSTAHEPNYAPSVQPEPVETVAAESMPIETISVEHMPAENIAEAQPEVDFSQAVEVVSPQLEEIEEATEQALINSPEQQAESFMEEDFTSPLDNLPVQEGSLIPEAILNDQALHTQTISEPEISSQEITHTLEETPEELLQAQEHLEALDHLLEDEASNQKTKQNHTEVDAQANTQADADAYINALLAEEKN